MLRPCRRKLQMLCRQALDALGPIEQAPFGAKDGDGIPLRLDVLAQAPNVLVEGAGLVFPVVDDVSKRDERNHKTDIDETQHEPHPSLKRLSSDRKRNARHPQSCKVKSMRLSVRAFASPKARRASTGVQPDLVL